MAKNIHLSLKLLLIFLLLFTLFPVSADGIDDIRRQLDNEVTIGTQYLVIIAINNYKEWDNLQRPVPDARKLRDILLKNYHMQLFGELYDEQATKAEILRLFEEIQKTLEVDDSLLIYYAGHGHLDEITNSGFWIAHDGSMDTYDQTGWIPNTQVRGFLQQLPAIHSLVIADSCFSGDLLNTTRGEINDIEISSEFYKKTYKFISRLIMTSGGIEYVPDRSEFSEAIKNILLKNDKQYIGAREIYTELCTGISTTTPLFAGLKECGHQEGASFLLFKRDTGLGRIMLILQEPGRLFIDGLYAGNLETGKNEINDLRTGSHELKVIYAGGIGEVVTVEVEARKTVNAEFRYNSEENKELHLSKKDYTLDPFLLTFYGGYAIPFTGESSLLLPSVHTGLRFSYALILWKEFRLSAMAGGSYLTHPGDRESEEIDSLSIISGFAGAQARYYLPFFPVLEIRTAVGGGYAYCLLDLTSESREGPAPLLFGDINIAYWFHETSFFIELSYLSVILADFPLYELTAATGIGFRF